MIPAAVVFAYLALVLGVGVFAFRARAGAPDAEDYFLAGRGLGATVFLLSLVGTNMTAFSILGASGHAFSNGIAPVNGWPPLKAVKAIDRLSQAA